MPKPGNPLPVDVAAAREHLAAATRELDRLCSGQPWRMRIPAQEDRDSDLVFAAALADLKASLTELERTLRDLAEAQITIRAFVEPEAEVSPDGQRIAWRCTGCRLDLDGNPRFCPRCGYTVYAPIRQKDETPPPAESLTRPPAGDNDSGYSWGPLPHPPWPTS